MASFVNSFALLEGDVQPSASTTTGKKKKSKKNKNSASSALPPSGANQAVASPAPAPQDDRAADDGFQLAGRLSRRSSMGSANPSTPAYTSKQRTLAEGIHDLEHAARETPLSQSADRVSQWKSWEQRVLYTD